MLEKNLILVTYNGPPGEIFSFMPDNGLASLSAFLIKEGFFPIIFDYLTTETFNSIFTIDFKRSLAEVNNLNLNPSGFNNLTRMSLLKKKINELIKRKESNIAREIISYIQQYKPSLIGFKLWEGLGFHGSIHIAGLIKKEFPKIFTVAGGPHVDMYGVNIMEYTDNFDFLVYGEGEIPLLELMKYVNGKSTLTSIPNLIYRDGTDIIKNPPELLSTLADLPCPVYDFNIYPAMEGNKKIKAYFLEESRGCPNTCRFCIHPRKSGPFWRPKSPDRIVYEMERIINNYSSSVFRFTGSNPPPGLITSVSEEIIKRRLSVKYSTFGHARNFEKEDYNLMKRAGCTSMAFGIESGSQYILDNAIGKNISVEQNKKALKASRDAGIYTIASIIVPSPYETEETKKETLDFLLNTRPDSVTVQCSMLTPNTGWWEETEKYGFQFKDKKSLAKKLMLKIPPFLLPPPLWDRIPYKLNGMGDREIIKVSFRFIDELRRNGINHGVSDFLALLALAKGDSVMELYNSSKEALLNGDEEKLMTIVRCINDKCNYKI